MICLFNMRAGSDIGYCDSDYRENQTISNFVFTEKDIKANIEALGFDLEDVILGENKMDLHLTDKETAIGYDYINLEYHNYETFTRKDFLREYDERFTTCYDVNKYEDETN